MNKEIVGFDSGDNEKNEVGVITRSLYAVGALLIIGLCILMPWGER